MLGPLLEFLKITEVGGKRAAREKEVKWEQQYDWAGRDLLNN